MISEQSIQSIQQRTDIVEVIEHFIHLKRRGPNYLGLCPFHGEKTPSFTISPSKGLYKCFGCGKSGSAIGFLMDYEKLTYVEALRWLANYYNIALEEMAMTEEVKEKKATAESLQILNRFAQQYFSHQLLHTEEGKNLGVSYFDERGFSTQSLHNFLLGYCPKEKSQFYMEALNKQHSKELLLKSGLCVLRNNEYKDAYYGRIIFPIQNHYGKIIGFGARTIVNIDYAPKYINTPENEIYIKSQTLYGIYQAKETIQKKDECFLVEGYTDVIGMHQADIKNTVASAGTSLTKEQLQIIHKYTQNLTIIYDGDKAGINATLRAIKMALQEGMNVYVLLIPGNEDPDSFILKNGKDNFLELLSTKKQDFLIFQLAITTKKIDNDPIKKNEAISQIAQTLANLKRVEDWIKRQEYIKKCAEILNIDSEALNALVNTYIKSDIDKEQRIKHTNIPIEVTPPTETNINIIKLPNDEESEKSLIRILLENGYKTMGNGQHVYQFIYNEIEPFKNDFENKILLEIIELYKKAYESGQISGEEDSIKYFTYHANKNISDLSIQVLHQTKAEWLDPDWEIKTGIQNTLGYQKDLISTISIIQLKKLRKLILQNQQDLLTQETDIDYLGIHQHLKLLESQVAQALQIIVRK
ncbi:MAG: DNA primase [Chitinophagaceae bacterium]